MERVLNFALHGINEAGEERGEGFDGEGALTGGLGFPLVRNGGQAGGGAPCSVGCLNMGVFDREEMEVVVRAPLFGEFGHERVCRAVVFVRVGEGEVAWGSAKNPSGVGELHACID